MNMKQSPTRAQFRVLLQRCDDRSGHHVIWISPGGGVHISPLCQGYTLAEWDRAMAGAYKARIDRIFAEGGDYVGPSAADDPDWVNQLYTLLTEAWDKAEEEEAAVR